MFKFVAPFFQIIGSSLKILPTAAWDELHIFLSSFFKIKWPTNFTLQLLLFWQMYMIFYAVLNGYGNSAVFLRYGLVFVSLILLKNYYRYLLYNLSQNVYFTVAFLYFFICVSLYVVGNYLGLSIAWWQETLWAGTAYSAYTIFILVAVSLLNSVSRNQRLLIMTLGFASGVAMDSRLVFLLLATLFPFIFISGKSVRRISLFGIARSSSLFILIIALIIFMLNTYIEEFLSVLNSVQATLIDLTSDNYLADRDSDRAESIMAIGSLMSDDPINFLFGSGLTSHQYELATYVEASSDGRVRPSGVPAVVFDGGIVYLIIILLCVLNSILQFISYYLNNLISFRTLSILVVVITNTFIVLFITNTTDLMLWWAVILSGTIFNKDLIHELNNRFA